jgi:LDH2 family malate/lactate/ureidoglycolate dehydrogenase
MGEIHDYANRGETLLPGWALDIAGNPTTDAQAAKAGSIAPFGQAKGYAMGLAFELLVSSLAGAALGRDVRGTLDDVEICNKGDVFFVIKGQQRDLQAYLTEIRSMEPAEGFSQVLVPGERGRACRAERLRNGVPVPDEIWTKLQILAGTQAAA